MSIDSASTAAAATAPRPVDRERPTAVSGGGRDGDDLLPQVPEESLSFWDVLDVINPLQHIPVVDHIYRSLTGDTIKPAAQVIGGMLYGGAVGAVAAIANAVMEQASGADVAGHVMSSLGLGGDESAAKTETATTAASAAAGATPSAAAQTSGAAPPTAGQPSLPQPAVQAAAAAPVGAPQTQAQPVRLNGTTPGVASPEAVRAARMPARDTALASTIPAKHAAALMAQQSPARFGPMSAEARQAAANAAGTQPAGPPGKMPTRPPTPIRVQAAQDVQAAPSTRPTASAQPPAGADPLPLSHPGYAGAASPAALPDIMMRNLQKYEQLRRAAAAKTAPSVNVSG